MLQNRVDPFGNIIKTSARGLWMGNRGVIHNEQQEIVKPFKNKAWITCVLEFKGRQRTVMTPDRWTELFFMDEATAFSAGHRPCFECRREDAKEFKTSWIQGNAVHNFTMSTSINEIDEVIHGERIDGAKKKLMHPLSPSEMPDGAFVLWNDEPYLFSKLMLHRWTPFGYEGSFAVPEASMLLVLTPRSIINAFRAGYSPQITLPWESFGLK